MERKTNIKNVKLYSTSDLIENAWCSFWDPYKINPENSTYNLRPRP